MLLLGTFETCRRTLRMFAYRVPGPHGFCRTLRRRSSCVMTIVHGKPATALRWFDGHLALIVQGRGSGAARGFGCGKGSSSKIKRSLGVASIDGDGTLRDPR